MYTVAGPYRCPVRRSKLLKGGLSRTKEFAKVDYPCPSGPASRRGGIEQPLFRAEKFLIKVFLALVCDMLAVAAARVPYVAGQRHKDDDLCPPPPPALEVSRFA